jgi:hypothetical protein
MRPERAPEHAGSIRKSGFIMVRSLEDGNTPIIIESWYEAEVPADFLTNTKRLVDWVRIDLRR